MSAPMTRRIVCLANSRKYAGWCVAGIQWDGKTAGPWIRPISGREHQEVSATERRYQDGSDPTLLDIIRVPLKVAMPHGHQSENYLLDRSFFWELDGKLSLAQLQTFPLETERLWLDGNHTRLGINDRIPAADLERQVGSLKLIRVESMSFGVCAPGAAFGEPKRRVQAQFKHAGQTYRLWVTDPLIEQKYLALPDGNYPSGGAHLTISLAEPYNDNCHKLVAAVIRSG